MCTVGWHGLADVLQLRLATGCCYVPTLESDDALSLVSGLQQSVLKMMQKHLKTANPTSLYAALPERPEDRAGL